MVFSAAPDQIQHNPASVVSVGSFDGVHLAHQQILRRLVESARRIGGRSVVVTFDPHPQTVLRPDSPVHLLTTIDERRDLVEGAGIDLMCVVPFTYDFSRMPWRDFLKTMLIDKIGLQEIVEGFNHHFGRNREGGIDAIRSYGHEIGFNVTMIDPVIVDGVQISSSKIREALREGDVSRAASYLGRPYALTGIVVKGDRRGAELGYPTANLQPTNSGKLIPADGIYVVEVDLGDGDPRYGLVSIGVRPTFHNDGPRTVEVFLMDFSGDLYDSSVTIRFLTRLRGEEKFPSRDALIRQMDTDTRNARAFLAKRVQNSH